ncbi:hypothetical protein D3C72_1935180 [compost metagenome]
MYRSPGTRRSWVNCSHWPWLSTISTPVIENTAPASCGRVTRLLKNRAPKAIIHSGMLAATSVTLMGPEVLSARYWKAL